MKVFGTFLLLAAYCAAQQATPGPADPNNLIRAETKVVLVEAVVTDKKGNYIRDLQQKDFSVFEDNKEQPIQSFSFEADPALPQSNQPHYLVLFFDDSMMDFNDRVAARKAASTFIGANAGPNRQMAIVHYAGSLQIAQNFTSDAERLKAIVSGTRLAAGQATTTPVRIRGNSGATNLGRAIRELAKNMATIPGRKTLVLLRSGFEVAADEMPDVTAAIDLCNRSNVAIYPIDVRGSVAGSTSSPTAEAQARSLGYRDLPTQEVGYTLANGTGGFLSVNSNDLLESMKKIGKEMNEFYLIGYRPPSETETCHLLRVKVDHSGTTVRMRAGYCNTDPKDLLAQTPVEKNLENRVSAPQTGNIAATMQTPYFFTSTNVARVDIAIEIPSASLKFEKEKGRLRSTINILGIISKEDGTVGARFSDAIEVNFETQKEIEEFRRRPYHYGNQLKLASGRYNLKAVISAGGENFGKLEQPLVVDAYDVKMFSVSPLALSTKSEKVDQADQGLATASLEGRTPLMVGGYEVTPSGSAKFGATDKPLMYFEIYEPALMAKEASNVELAIRLRVFDTKGTLKSDSGGLRIQVPEKAGSPAIPVAMQVPVTKLEPGSYKVEVFAEDSLHHKFSRSANFEVQ